MEEQMKQQQQAQEPQAQYAKPDTKHKAGDYIDFEEVD
jgi:hypothetical protein